MSGSMVLCQGEQESQNLCLVLCWQDSGVLGGWRRGSWWQGRGETFRLISINFCSPLQSSCRVAALSRSQGWEAGPGQLGKVVGDTRRALSVTIVRANAMCLLEQLSQLGPGAGAAAKRRQVALRLEEGDGRTGKLSTLPGKAEVPRGLAGRSSSEGEF